jgi:hypothetical protein
MSCWNLNISIIADEDIENHQKKNQKKTIEHLLQCKDDIDLSTIRH